MKLYTYKICAFVERVNIVMNELDFQCEQVFIDIRNKPKSFLDLPGADTVPKLVLSNGERTHFIPDTISICNFFNDINHGKLHPSDPKKLALNTYWIHMVTPIIVSAYYMSIASDLADFNQHKEQLFEKLDLLEELASLIVDPYFNGAQYHMIDFAYAPQFKRFECLERLYNINLLENYPVIRAWSDATLAIPSVKKTLMTSHYDELYKEFLNVKQSVILHM